MLLVAWSGLRLKFRFELPRLAGAAEKIRMVSPGIVIRFGFSGVVESVVNGRTGVALLSLVAAS
jgi:hypothetical protein